MFYVPESLEKRKEENPYGRIMDDDLKSVRELLAWNRRVLVFGGLWPLEKSYIRFYVSLTYFVAHMFLTFSDLVTVFGDMALTITNLLEASTQLRIAAKMFAIRYSNLLVGVVQRVHLNGNEDRYVDRAEKKLFLSYNTIGRFFFQTGSVFCILTIIMLFLKPFESISRDVSNNETINWMLPCRMKLYYEIQDARVYALVYISQFPMMYYYYFDMISTCFICTLIVNVAGNMSILAHRIRQINATGVSKAYSDPTVAFRNLLVEHQEITSTGTALDDAFNLVLLVEVSVITVLIGLTCYNMLENSITVSTIDFLFVLNYSVALLVLIFVYCILGEMLITESTSVHDAYYESRWYEMRVKYQKNLTICMIGAQKPLQLTAGRFYIFSLPQFSGVLKTSAAYISMLRTVA